MKTSKYPRIRSAIAVDDRTLLIRFDNEIQKRYDIGRLLDLEAFRPLRNAAVFKGVKVDTGGYAVYWDNDIDISEHELWKNGLLVEN